MKKCKKNMEELFSDNDIATEILSRLPVKSLMAFKCTAKRWYGFLSDPLFLRIHYQRSNDVTVLVMQHMKRTSDNDTEFDSLDLLTPTKTGYALNCKSLDFLPEKVNVLSSSHGILCCRSWVDGNSRMSKRKGVTYICNPITRQWVQFSSNVVKDDMVLNPGFAFYPTCSSSSSGLGAASIFKLVRIFYNRKLCSYSFDIYSSDTKKWKKSKAVCKTQPSACPLRLYNNPPKVIFANGWFHWWTYEYEIIAFHVEKELSKVIKLPRAPHCPIIAYAFAYICWGESEGYFHYVYAQDSKLQVWVLKNYEEEEEKPAWELKYCLDMVCFRKLHPSLHLNSFQALNFLTFHEDILYIKPYLLPSEENVGNLFSYEFRTKTLVDHGKLLHDERICPVVVPFSASLLPLDGVRRNKRNRKRKLLEI